MSEQQHFEQLIVGMLNSSNDIRNMAEKEYEKISLQQKGTLLLNHYLNSAASVESRSMALVLLRRIIASNYQEFWNSVGKANQEHFHQQMIKCVTEEKELSLRNKLTDVLAELSRNTINEETGKQEWVGILQLIEICATSEDASLREIGMSLIESVPNIFGSDYLKYLNGIKQMFHSSLLYGANSSVRTAAVRAYVAFVCDNDENDAVVRSLSDLVPAVIKVCQHVVAEEDEDDIPLQCLGDLATSLPKLLVPHLNELFTLCLTTVGDAQKDDSYRHSSLEVMVSLCESAPNVMRKKGATYLPTLIQSCLQMMTDLDEDITEWLSMDDAEDEIEEENANIGETSLDRISCALGGKTILTTTLQFITDLLKNPDWKFRHAGIMALSTIGEGCKRQMEQVIHQILNEMILPRIQNTEHPRVRYAACNAIGQMCTDFAPTMQKRCHERIVPALLATLVDLECPRVSAHAGAAIVNFCEDCPKNIISIYLTTIMEKMEFVLNQTFQHLIDHGKKIVLEQIITSIASVADAAEDHFASYYSKLMPPLKYILENANTEKLRLLRGKTIECVTLIGLAVGSNIFREDAHHIMKLLLANGINFQYVSDDPQISYLISAWARICKILGPEFAQYLESVMPTVIAAAEFEPDVAIINDEQANDEDDGWKYVSLGDEQSIGIKTSGLEDKVTACEMLVCYARELEATFAPYVERVMTLMLPLLRFLFHDGVRSAAAECLPCLMVCAKVYGTEFIKQMWATILPAYKEAIEKETDLEVTCELLNGIAQCVENFGDTIISNIDLQTIFTIIFDQLKKFDKRREDRERQTKDEDADDEDEEQLREIVELESSVLARISDLIHYMFKAFNERLIPYFNQMVPQFAALLDPRRPFQDRQWGICIFDDLIEFGGPTTINYQDIFLQPIVSGLQDNYPEVRQASAYGCGLMGHKGGLPYAQICAQLLHPLAASIARPDSRSTEEDTVATENAISAVAKILKYNNSSINTNEVIPTFISWLPVTNDAEEVPHVYEYFCDLIETNHPLVLGENNSNLGRIFQIILFTFTHGVFDDDSAEELKSVKTRLTNIMKMIKANDPIFQGIVNGLHLNGHQQRVLAQILS